MNTKSSSANVHGFSPFQLTLGENPKLPSLLNDKPPAIPSRTTSRILIDNLTTIQKAREAYVASESPEKIRRVLNRNVRTSGDIKYIKNDSVYFKRVSNRRWRGPVKVLGQDRQQVLVQYRSSYVRVRPYRVARERNHNKTDNKVSATLTPNDSIQEQPKKRNYTNFNEDSYEELGI